MAKDIQTKHMRLALRVAKSSVPEDERVHPKVGAVLVRNGKVAATAHRGELSQGEHAEYTLLERKLTDQDLRDSILYTTLEPCTTRKHPKSPCAKRIVQRHVSAVVIGMLDPNPKICGRGERWLVRHGVDVYRFPPELMKMAEEQNRAFREHVEGAACEQPSDRRRPSRSIDLSGRWYAVWQSTVDGRECVNAEVVDITQRGNQIVMCNLNRSLENPRGGYIWRGELKLYDNSRLMGHYLAAEPNVTAKGVLYFFLNHVGQFMSGKWVGCNHDFELTWGFGVLARDIERAREKFKQLKTQTRGLVS